MLWDDLLSGQSFDGPYDSAISMCTAAYQMLTMLFARLDDSQYISEAKCCNATYYPRIPDFDSDGGMERYEAACAEFLAHVR